MRLNEDKKVVWNLFDFYSNSENLSELKQGSAQTFIKRFSVGLDLQFVVLGCKFECRSTHNRRSLDLEASSDC